MRYELEPTGKRSISSIIVTHKDKAIHFNGTQKVNGGNADEELFKFWNDYFETCDEDVLDKHWDLLVKAKRILEPGYFDEKETKEIVELREKNGDYKFLIEKLVPILKQMYVNIKPFNISYAADVMGFTRPPSDLTHMTKQGEYPEETTIDEYKYKELASLAFIAQLSFPPISQFLDHITMMTGKEYKDAVGGELVNNLTDITETVGFGILDTYLRFSYLRQKSKRNAVGVASDVKYIDHIIYKGLFNKLCLTFLPSNIKGKNLSKELNSLIEGEIRGTGDNKFKSYTDPKPNGEDLSLAESYTISQEINGSDELAQACYFNFTLFRIITGYDENDKPYPIKQYLTDKPGFFEKQCKGLGIKNNLMAEKIFNSIPDNWNFILTDIHIKLLQLAFQYKINYNLYPALNYEQIKSALSLAQTLLFELGFENLACVMFAIRNKDLPRYELGDNYKLSTKEKQLLVDICSDYVGQQTNTSDNSAVISVSDFLDELAASGWESNIELGLLGNEKYLSMMSGSHSYPLDISPDVKKELLDLIILRNGLTSTEESK